MPDYTQLLTQILSALQDISKSLQTLAAAAQNSAVDTDLQSLNKLVGQVVQKLPTP